MIIVSKQGKNEVTLKEALMKLEEFLVSLTERNQEKKGIRRNWAKRLGGLGNLKIDCDISFSNLAEDCSIQDVELAERNPFRKQHPRRLADVIDLGNCLTVVVEVPGAQVKDIEVSVKGKRLLISALGSRSYYHETILLPILVENEPIETVCKNGVLEIKLRKMR